MVGRVTLAAATDGAEPPVYVPATGLLYRSLPGLHHVKAEGAIAVINPRTRRLARLIHVRQCMPAGLALGPHTDLLVGCSDDAVIAGFWARSLILDARADNIVARIVQVGGSDEVYADPRSGKAFGPIGASRNGGPCREGVRCGVRAARSELNAYRPPPQVGMRVPATVSDAGRAPQPVFLPDGPARMLRRPRGRSEHEHDHDLRLGREVRFIGAQQPMRRAVAVQDAPAAADLDA